MGLNEFKKLRTGDLVKHKMGEGVYVVTANFGDRVTAVKSVDMTNPDEWLLIRPINFKDVARAPDCGPAA